MLYPQSGPQSLQVDRYSILNWLERNDLRILFLKNEERDDTDDPLRKQRRQDFPTRTYSTFGWTQSDAIL